MLQAALARSNSTLAIAAKLLGVSRPTLYGLMEAHGIEIEPAGAADAGAAADEPRLDMEMRSHRMRKQHLGWLLLTRLARRSVPTRRMPTTSPMRARR